MNNEINFWVKGWQRQEWRAYKVVCDMEKVSSQKLLLSAKKPGSANMSYNKSQRKALFFASSAQLSCETPSLKKQKVKNIDIFSIKDCRKIHWGIWKAEITSVPVISVSLQAECQENNLGKPADRTGYWSKWTYYVNPCRHSMAFSGPELLKSS